MSNGFWVATAFAVALAGPAFASPHSHASAPRAPAAALPDFPADAEPGACYARLREDGSRADGPAGGKGTWTLKRGHGPEAVWRYSEEGGAPGARAAGHHWVRVLCEDGRTPYAGGGYAAIGPSTGTTGAGLTPPPPLLVPPAPERRPFVAVIPAPHAAPHHDGPPAMHGAPHHPAPLMPEMAPPSHPPMHPMPPMVEMHPPMHPAPHHGGPAPQPFFVPAPGAHGPAFHFSAPLPPQPIARPRWFGDRMLTWAGKPY